jgi:hypothetical protein
MYQLGLAVVKQMELEHEGMLLVVIHKRFRIERAEGTDKHCSAFGSDVEEHVQFLFPKFITYILRLMTIQLRLHREFHVAIRALIDIVWREPLVEE